jgi:hypothetical protein
LLNQGPGQDAVSPKKPIGLLVSIVRLSVVDRDPLIPHKWIVQLAWQRPRDARGGHLTAFRDGMYQAQEAVTSQKAVGIGEKDNVAIGNRQATLQGTLLAFSFLLLENYYPIPGKLVG